MALPGDAPPPGAGQTTDRRRLREAGEQMCRRLAKQHYENFLVASLLLPRRLRQPFYNLYAFCRTADDLADAAGDPQQNRLRLDQWQHQLDACYDGTASHPMFIALSATIGQFDLPRQPFYDLLSAFRQDQQYRQYETFDHLLQYCRRSANPVGRLVLHLAGVTGSRQLEWSDQICTGLQLTNFCQDVDEDLMLGRVYLPQEDLRRFHVDRPMLDRRQVSDALRQLLRFQVDRAEQFLRAGLPLADQVPPWLGRDVRLFAHGGLAALDAVRRADYDVWTRKPKVSRRRQAWLLVRAAVGMLAE